MKRKWGQGEALSWIGVFGIIIAAAVGGNTYAILSLLKII